MDGTTDGEAEPRTSRPSLIDALAGRAPASAPRRPLAATGLFLIALGAVLYLGRVVFIPLTLALMVSFVFNPLVRLLHRIRVPKELAAAVVVLGLCGGIGVAAVQLSTPASEWATRLPQSLRTIEHRIAPLKRPVDEANRLAARVERLTDTDPREPGVREVRLQESGLATSALQTAGELVAQAAVVVFALYFLLIWGDRLLERVICLLPDIGDRDRASQVIRHIERRMSAYLGTITVIFACIGVAVGTSVHLLGLPNPVLWGVMAFCLHYIPYVGSAIGIAVIGLASLVTFPDIKDALLPPLAYLALTTLEGNVITPVVLGRTCALSPLVIFVWLVLWGWLWGIFGAVIAVPLLMLIRITCEQSQALAPIAAFLRR